MSLPARTGSPRPRYLHRPEPSRRWLRPWLLSTIVLAATAVPASTAAAATPAPIRPHQFFVGLVNGQTVRATIRMACFGPVRPGQTGHPMAGQTVEALPLAGPVTAQPGYTGSLATRLQVTAAKTLDASGVPVLNEPVTLTAYGTPVAIPDTWVLPCYGSAPISFVPDPTSATAHTATVQASFAGQP